MTSRVATPTLTRDRDQGQSCLPLQPVKRERCIGFLMLRASQVSRTACKEHTQKKPVNAWLCAFSARGQHTIRQKTFCVAGNPPVGADAQLANHRQEAEKTGSFLFLFLVWTEHVLRLPPSLPRARVFFSAAA
jgi:hypothetical protein